MNYIIIIIIIIMLHSLDMQEWEKCVNFGVAENILAEHHVTDDIGKTRLAPYPLQHGNWPYK